MYELLKGLSSMASEVMNDPSTLYHHNFCEYNTFKIPDTNL